MLTIARWTRAGALPAGMLWLVVLPAPIAAAAEAGKIAFTRDGDVWVMEADGSGKTRLTGGSAYDRALWSPDGTMLAVIRCCSRKQPNLWAIRVMNADGSGRGTITDGVRHSIQHAAWSLDGTRIAFTDMNIDDPDAAAPYPSAIVVVAVDGTAQTRLTGYPAGNAEPTWSPDGTRIAYTRSDDEDTEIFVMNADGSGKRQLTDNEVTDLDPQWSPNVAEIVYGSAIPGPGGGDAGVALHVIDADGTLLRTLTDGTRHDRNPLWSPDGSAVLFVGQDFAEPYDVGLWVVDADGTDETRLAATDFDPAWSPDGTRIVFPWEGDIHVIGVDGTGETTLARGRAWDAYPDWQSHPAG